MVVFFPFSPKMRGKSFLFSNSNKVTAIALVFIMYDGS